MLLLLPTIAGGRSEATGSLEEVAEEADVLSLLVEGSPPPPSSSSDGLFMGDCGADWLDSEGLLDNE